ncbi:hypothetical protein CGLO_10297 [Colletotrichum gloeosporioides Cg-14]|uniref:2EXR domain-containing protein n=1 Tax=Colletotrichum gloeosporioides (strain Cg-14) TaxID=1237896 RepID=T0LQ10_COLGC|nr:hypothetical protein CGLO_10297 [Colletotrichum gloeosporioides Cg-14]
MASTFTLFRELPPELRWPIWELAISPQMRGAHFFSVQEEKEPANAAGRKVFAAPSTFTPATHPGSRWLHENPSAYAAEYGLWSACRESRSAISQYFTKRYPRRLPYPDRVYDKPEAIGIRNVRIDGFDAPFATFPDGDLAVRDLGCIGNQSTFAFREAIAFEYDDSWAFDPNTQTMPELMEMPGPRSLFLRLVAARATKSWRDLPGLWGCGSPRIYVIEHDATFPPYAKLDTYSHFSANGFRLVERRNPHVVGAHKRGMTAWDFIALVREWIGGIDARRTHRQRNVYKRIVGEVLVAQLRW